MPVKRPGCILASWKEGVTLAAFQITFSNVLLSLLYLLPGVLICKAKLVRPEHMGSISAILLYICGPGMFLNAVIALDFSWELTWKMALFFIITLVTMVIGVGALFLLFRRHMQEFRYRMMTIASVLGNAGFFGLPIMQSLFPDAPIAAVYSCVYCASMNVIAWTVGVFTVTGDKKHISLKAAFVNPTMISLSAGILLYALGAKLWLPELVTGCFGTLSKMSTPLCMFVLGIRLGTMSWKRLFGTPFVYGIALCKLLLFPLLCYLLTLPFPLDPVFRAGVLILSATPCASIILSLAEMHGNGQELAANCAVLTTLLSIVTIPLLSLLL